MNISQLVNNSVNTHANNLPKTASQKTQEKSTTLASDNVDKFDSNSANVNRNYNSRPDRTDFINVQGYRNASVLQMKNAVVADFVNYSMSQQSQFQSGIDFLNNIMSGKFVPRPFAENAYKAAEATSEKYEDYWGVEAVAERIFTFAKALAGDREDLFNTMKNAFLKGFSQAEGVFKGKLHDVSYQTKERVLEYFNEWEKEIAAKKNPALVEDEK